MQMPKDPPTSGLGVISLGFAEGSIDIGDASGNTTVTSGAAIISSDVGDTKGWSADQGAYVAAGMPSDCGRVDATTFKINKQ